MKIKIVRFAAIWLLSMPLALPLVAQTPAIPTMDHEPHHHLALHNEYVKIFNVIVSPGDSIILHSHDQNTIAIAIGDQLVTVGIPGKTIPPSKNADGQVRLQRSGYIHSTHVDGDTPYHTVAVELMQPQTNFHNLCAEILPGQPMNCPREAESESTDYSTQPLLASNETEVLLLRIHPHKSMKLRGVSSPQLVVALDETSIPKIALSLHPGDFNWADNSGSVQAGEYRNGSDRDARIIEIIFPVGH
jgi:uncharacterized Zn-binding protein involved in type VI secretion